MTEMIGGTMIVTMVVMTDTVLSWIMLMTVKMTMMTTRTMMITMTMMITIEMIPMTTSLVSWIRANGQFADELSQMLSTADAISLAVVGFVQEAVMKTMMMINIIERELPL